METPYYLALFQGKDFTINTKVNKISTMPNWNIGFMEIVWIQCEKYEWLIDLNKQTIQCKNGADKHFRSETFEKKWRKNGDHQIRYWVNTIFGNIELASLNRQVIPSFNSYFFEYYKNFDDCIGAFVSEEKVRYLDNLYEIQI